MEIAGACGVKKHKERDVAFIFFAVCSDGLCAVNARTEPESKEHLFNNARVTFVDNVHCKGSPNIFGVFYCFSESVKVFFGECSAHKLLSHIYKLNKVFFGIFFDIFINAVKRYRSGCSFHFFSYGHHRYIPPSER